MLHDIPILYGFCTDVKKECGIFCGELVRAPEGDVQRVINAKPTPQTAIPSSWRRVTTSR